MSKAQLNLVIDALLCLGMGAIVGIGFLIKYVLVPGLERWEIYGRNVELLFWGMDRHQWGTVHYGIGCGVLGLLVLHVVLHWGMIVRIFSRLLPSRVLRPIAAVLVMALFAFAISPEVREGGRGLHGRGGGHDAGSAHRHAEP